MTYSHILTDVQILVVDYIPFIEIVASKEALSKSKLRSTHFYKPADM
jgi:hypothetical protein